MANRPRPSAAILARIFVLARSNDESLLVRAILAVATVHSPKAAFSICRGEHQTTCTEDFVTSFGEVMLHDSTTTPTDLYSETDGPGHATHKDKRLR